LTLDRTVQLVRKAMEIPGLSLRIAIKLVEYHIGRNEIATRSHTKTWKETLLSRNKRILDEQLLNYLFCQQYQRVLNLN
jgi:hypothetical protein